MDKKNNRQQVKFELDKEAPINSETVRQLIKSTVLKMGDKANKDEKLSMAKMLSKIFEQGMSPREAMKLTEPEVAQIYASAFQMFSSGKFMDAREMFKMLLILEPFESGFALSLGACHHHLKSYDHALQAYLLASSLAPEDPVPLFYAYDCYKTLKDQPAAAIMLSNVVAKAGDKPTYAKIKGRAVLLLEELERQIALVP